MAVMVAVAANRTEAKCAIFRAQTFDLQFRIITIQLNTTLTCIASSILLQFPSTWGMQKLFEP
jgi:hypothetical protein